MNDAQEPEWFTVLVVVSSGTEMASHHEYNRWMSGLEKLLGVSSMANDPNGWAVGDWRGHRVLDWTGQYRMDRTAYANVWQNVSGDVVSIAMAHVWAAIHLIAPLEQAGYHIQNTWAGRTADMVWIG